MTLGPPPRVFVTRQLFPEVIEMLRAAAEVRVWPSHLPPPYEELAREARPCHGLLTLITDRIDEPLLDGAPELRVVSNMGVGYNNIDVAATTAHGIFVGNTPGVLTETTADLTFALLLAWARRIPESAAFARSGEWKTWEPMRLLGTDVYGATLGIVGLGRIGLAVAQRAKGFAMRLLYHSRTRKPEAERELGLEYAPSLHDLLARSDFVTLHVPLTPETRHLISQRDLSAMKPTSVLINTSRGEVVDQKALYEALRVRRIAGAALDVTDPEPISPTDPLLTLDNVLVLPHIGSATDATRRRMAIMAAQNLLDSLAGRVPTHCVNPEAAGQRR